MLSPSVAVIVAIYKDLKALQLIIESLESQTKIPDEIIIAEDAQHLNIKEYVDSLNYNNIIHLSQEDIGWRKEKILNKAIETSKSDYLIFIDGDCIPYHNFVKANIELSEPNTALCGRRSEPGEGFSEKLRKGKISIKKFEKSYLLNYFKLMKDKTRHIEEGIVFSPNSLILKILNKFGRKDSHIVGCNWSCYKKDLVTINGYDEDFILPTTGEDTDVERRLRHFGVRMKSSRNAAAVVHLHHISIFNKEIASQTEALMETKKDIYVCKNGLKKL
ncbi:glycosyltransferase [Sulfurimonas aquatica]|uniref:Glycosyltransferase n=1 Tax=Sulfurimonas aquatica TaxID=2672570 RepID=A0A975GC40_9BACT|nr:glycosyltransferase [Sulfurimonas aquatica]QSZ41331.1 glycosyltransferase [Sulfurimonas aquatica]